MKRFCFRYYNIRLKEKVCKIKKIFQSVIFATLYHPITGQCRDVACHVWANTVRTLQPPDVARHVPTLSAAFYSMLGDGVS